MRLFHALELLLVTCGHSIALPTSVMNQTVDGSFSNDGEFHFVIYSENLKGIILHCVDSENIVFAISATKQADDKDNIAIRVNEMRKEVAARDLCRCDRCSRVRLDFRVAFQRGLINVMCNNGSSVEIPLRLNTDQENGKGRYETPMDISRGRSGTFIMMGNSGPYVTGRNTTSFPDKYQIIMCLDRFLYNNAPISFIGGDGRVQPSCPRKCTNTTCNGGVCTDIVYGDPKCDCLFRATGPYCNNSMKIFDPRGNNSYQRINESSRVHVEMMWKVLVYKEYCLLDLVKGRESVTVSIINKRLHVDSSLVSPADIDGKNYVSVNISDNTLIVKTKNREFGIGFLLRDLTRINVGFSESKKKCQKFEGAIDFTFNKDQLTPIVSIYDSETSTITSSWYRINVTGSTYIVTPTTNTVYILLVVLLILMSMCIVNSIVYFRKRNAKTTVTPRNVYELENVDINIRNTSPYDVIDDRPYSKVDYGSSYIISGNVEEDIDGYMLPKINYPDTTGPPPPPRD